MDGNLADDNRKFALGGLAVRQTKLIPPLVF
jgi:hypothetical protein